MADSICNKCGDRKPLVFEAHVCESCSRTLDEIWSTNDSTDWVLIEQLAVGVAPAYGPHVGIRIDQGQILHTFRRTNYSYVKSVWAAYKGPNWSIRPATAEEIANGSRRLQVWYAIDETLQKWGFDQGGNPPGGIWHDVALLCGNSALEELKKRLAALGFFPRLDGWQLPQMGLSLVEISKLVDEHPSIQAIPATSAADGQSQIPEYSATQGDCYKCGARTNLVFKSRVCQLCIRALDGRWEANTSTDWLLVEHLAEEAEATYHDAGRPNGQGEVLHTFRQVSYAYMKCMWAAYDSTCSIRPATSEDLADGSLTLQIWEEVAAIVGKWGFDVSGQPAGGVWDDSTQLRGGSALEEVRRRLKELGLQLPDDWEIADGGLSASEIEEFAHEIGTPHPYAGRFWQELAKEQGWKRGCSSKMASLVLAKLGIKRVEEQSSITLLQRGLSQVVGMSELKQQLNVEIIGPFRHPELYHRYRVSVPNGILFFGPPGCGKTYIARSLAEELGFFFQYCRPSDVASPYIHDTVSKIRGLFTAAIEKAPSVLFIDEFEAFVPARSELGGHQSYKAEEVNEFLANLEGCAERNVLVIAATNEPWKIDQAVLRPGRFDKHILISPPDAEARAAMLAHYLQGRPLAEGIDCAGIAAVLDGYSAADIKFLTDEAARIALAQSALISTETLLAGMGRVPPSIAQEDQERYSSFRPRGV